MSESLWQRPCDTPQQRKGSAARKGAGFCVLRGEQGMRMAREKSHSGNAHGRPGSRALLLGGVAFALILAGIVSVTLANHSTTTWDFSSAASYTYDANKIAVVGGVAHLRNSFTVTHSAQADFNAGTYSSTVYNTSAPAGVRLSGPPTAGTYTSPAIDAGVATTTWKTLTHIRDLQQAVPPATFGAKTVVGTQSNNVNEINAADFNRDGAVDIVATSTSGTRDVWIYQSSATNPPTFSAKKVTDDGTAPCSTGVDAALSSVAAARYGIGDMDNDLAPDLVEPGTQTINTKPLFLSVNPLASPGGTPQCWTRWLINGRMLEDIRIADINGATYTSTDPFKNGQPILDIVAVESTIGTGSAPSPSGGVFWLRNDGTVAPDAPVFGTRSIDACTLGAASTTGPTTVVAGDLNNDGIVDVVAGWPFTMAACTRSDNSTRAATSPQVLGYLSSGGDPPTWTAFTVAGIATGGSATYSADLLLGDIDGDGFLDIIHANTSANTITWYKNPCTSTPCSTATITAPGAWTAFTVDASATGVSSLAVADLDLDGRLDIVANSSNTTTGVAWYQNNGGNPVTWTKRTLTTSIAATGVVVANHHSNGDRAPDIIASGTSGTVNIDWWANNILHSNIRFQVRTWSLPDCSTPSGTFVGPDGTTGTYYTSTSENLRVANNQCFQYKVS